VKKGNAAISQVCIKWLRIPDATWEDWSVLVAKFPEVASWGQDGVSARGGVTPSACTGARQDTTGED
jgi:hypothetical protein